MDENKEFETNETEEAVEEVVEEAAEAVEEVVEEAAEAVEEAAEEAAEAAEEAFEETAETVLGEMPEFPEEIAVPEKSKKTIVAVVAVVAVIAILVVIGFATKLLPWNKYNHMGYVNITGRTMEDIAKDSGMEYEELLKEYGLPEDMPKNTEESAAYYTMPVKSVAKMYGMDFATMKEMLGFGDEITEDTPWGEAEGEVTIEKYVGKENFDSFKEEYGFGDEVTLETKWKEVRKAVDMAAKKKYDEQKAEEQKAEEAPAEETEAPAEEEPAEEEAPAEEAE